MCATHLWRMDFRLQSYSAPLSCQAYNLAVKRLALLLILFTTACASATPEPTRGAGFVFITQTPSPVMNASPTDEPLPFRDLSSPTPSATAIPPSPTPAPFTATLQPTTLPTRALISNLQSPVPSQPPAPQPTAAAVQPVDDVASAEQVVIDLTNSYRAQNGLPPLARDEAIMHIARSRSADMVARDYFDHTDPLTGALLAKPQVLALGYGRSGENIYWSGAGLANFPAQSVNWFIADPPHRANILNSGYTAIGVGIVWNGLGWTLTQNFGGP